MAGDYTLDELSRLSREERRRLRVGRRRSRGKRLEKRRKFGRQELLDYLRENDFRSYRKLDAGRGLGDPAYCDYRKEFGSWKKATELAFGKDFAKDITWQYLVKTVVLLGLWTRRRYEEAHRKNPDIVPSYWYVRKEFKRWAILRYYAERYDGQRMLSLYMRLYRQLGHEPTIIECETREVDKHMLERLFGGEKTFREMAKVMARNAKRT